jgi:hypothetical protein
MSPSHLNEFYRHIREYLPIYGPPPLNTNARKDLSPIPTEWAARLLRRDRQCHERNITTVQAGERAGDRMIGKLHVLCPRQIGQARVTFSCTNIFSSSLGETDNFKSHLDEDGALASRICRCRWCSSLTSVSASTSASSPVAATRGGGRLASPEAVAPDVAFVGVARFNGRAGACLASRWRIVGAGKSPSRGSVGEMQQGHPRPSPRVVLLPPSSACSPRT